MSQQTSPTNSLPKNAADRVVKYWEQRGKLTNWMGILVGESMERDLDRTNKSQEAEEAWVRKNLWGATDSETAVAEDDDMGQKTTVLGDILQPQPPAVINYPPPAKESNNLLPALVLGGAMLGGGYLLSQMNKPEPPKVPSFEDESTSIGLGKLEDYER